MDLLPIKDLNLNTTLTGMKWSTLSLIRLPRNSNSLPHAAQGPRRDSKSGGGGQTLIVKIFISRGIT